MRDIAFYFRKKAGFTRMSDSGLVDAVIGGECLSVRVVPFYSFWIMR